MSANQGLTHCIPLFCLAELFEPEKSGHGNLIKGETQHEETEIHY